MAAPEKPDIDYSYTGFAQGLGNGLFPGTQLDNDLANLKQSIDEMIDFTTAVIRDDGKLQNGVATKASLDSSLSLGVAPPRPWVTGRAYVVDETATINNSIFICIVAHSSGTFASDLGAGFWGLIAELTVPAAISDLSVTEPKHADGGVSTRALAAGAVTNAKIGPQAVSNDKLATSTVLALTPIGAEIDFAGVVAPTGWVFEFGQALSRVTYAALFNVLCPSVAGATTNGSPVLTGVVVDLRDLGLEGAPIEGANIPTGTTIVSVAANSITMSVNATGSAASVVARILPWGVGDGGTTFNVPDARDRTSLGRGNMGGAAAGRVTSSGAGNPGLGTGRLGAAGGVDRHVLSSAQMPAHGHTATSTVTDPGHQHAYAVYNDALASAAAGITVQGTEFLGLTPATTTGITVATTLANTGGGEAHPNLPPSRVTNKIIFTGVL